MRSLFLRLLVLSALPMVAAGADTDGTAVLLVFHSGQAHSALDARGAREALQELRTPVVELDLALQPLRPAELARHTRLLLAHATLDPTAATAVAGWVSGGGGLVASGRAGLSLQPVLGLDGLAEVPRFPSGGAALSEIRFGVAHPVSTGSFWSGASAQTPPMPASELPNQPQLLYPRGDLPAFTATAAGASVLARWRDAAATWSAADGAPAVFAHSFGQGRAVYFGALPGGYAEWAYPFSWRQPIQEALAWVDTRGVLIELGHWPQAARAAFAFSADTERPAMRTVVPALLALFQQLELDAFGTFFLVGQAGGDAGTEGAVENPAVVAAIVAAGAEVAGHGDIHTRFAGQSLAVQGARLAAMRQLIEGSTAGVPPVVGFRGPGLAVDRDTWRGAFAAGLAYDSSDQDVWCECSLPWFTGEVWSLPPSAPMDFALIENYRLGGAEFAQIISDKARYVASRRGLFNWVTHPWIVGGQGATGENLLPAVQTVLASAREDGGFWMQRLDRILEWWLQREALRIEPVERGDFHLRLRLRNSAEVAVRAPSLWLRLPPAEHAWAATVDGAAQPLRSRQHGVAEPRTYQVLVVPQVDAQAVVEIELRQLRPEAVFRDGFEG